MRGLPVLALAVASLMATAWPFAFRDPYRSLAAVNRASTTALVDPRGSGTVRLPYLPAQLAMDPAGRIVLLATAGGLGAYVVSGGHPQPVPGWRLGTVAATGVAWLDGGRALAVATSGTVAVYGLVAELGRRRVARLAEAAVVGREGIAPGPPGIPLGVLIANPSGAGLYGVEGRALRLLDGGPADLTGNRGVASDNGGRRIATWGRSGVQLWAWNGGRYVRTPAWDPPDRARTDGPVIGVAFFPHGDGYWVLGAWGVLRAYGFGRGRATELVGLSFALPVSAPPPVAVATAWGPDGVAVLEPRGWQTFGVAAGGGPVPVPAWSLGALRLAIFQPRAVLTSVPLPVAHTVNELRAEDANCPGARAPCRERAHLPPGTGVRYGLSARGCRAWVPAAAATNVVVPPGARVCYRLVLTTSAPTRTPVVDVTNVYELVRRRTRAALPSLLCRVGACPRRSAVDG